MSLTGRPLLDAAILAGMNQFGYSQSLNEASAEERQQIAKKPSKSVPQPRQNPGPVSVDPSILVRAPFGFSGAPVRVGTRSFTPRLTDSPKELDYETDIRQSAPKRLSPAEKDAFVAKLLPTVKRAEQQRRATSIANAARSRRTGMSQLDVAEPAVSPEKVGKGAQRHLTRGPSTVLHRRSSDAGDIDPSFFDAPEGPKSVEGAKETKIGAEKVPAFANAPTRQALAQIRADLSAGDPGRPGFKIVYHRGPDEINYAEKAKQTVDRLRALAKDAILRDMGIERLTKKTRGQVETLLKDPRSAPPEAAAALHQAEKLREKASKAVGGPIRIGGRIQSTLIPVSRSNIEPTVVGGSVRPVRSSGQSGRSPVIPSMTSGRRDPNERHFNRHFRKLQSELHDLAAGKNVNIQNLIMGKITGDRPLDSILPHERFAHVVAASEPSNASFALHVPGKNMSVGDFINTHITGSGIPRAQHDSLTNAVRRTREQNVLEPFSRLIEAYHSVKFMNERGEVVEPRGDHIFDKIKNFHEEAATRSDFSGRVGHIRFEPLSAEEFAGAHLPHEKRPIIKATAAAHDLAVGRKFHADVLHHIRSGAPPTDGAFPLPLEQGGLPTHDTQNLYGDWSHGYHGHMQRHADSVASVVGDSNWRGLSKAPGAGMEGGPATVAKRGAKSSKKEHGIPQDPDTKEYKFNKEHKVHFHLNPDGKPRLPDEVDAAPNASGTFLGHHQKDHFTAKPGKAPKSTKFVYHFSMPVKDASGKDTVVHKTFTQDDMKELGRAIIPHSDTPEISDDNHGHLNAEHPYRKMERIGLESANKHAEGMKAGQRVGKVSGAIVGSVPPADSPASESEVYTNMDLLNQMIMESID